MCFISIMIMNVKCKSLSVIMNNIGLHSLRLGQIYGEISKSMIAITIFSYRWFGYGCDCGR